MRLFVSCNVPQDVAGYVRTIAGKIQNARLSVPRNVDLTIKFLGDVPADRLEEIKKRLSKLEFRAFEAALDGIGLFSEDFIRVVWVGLKPAGGFVKLHEQADELLAHLFPKEKRFQPHITVARVKSVDDKPKFVESVKKIRIEPKRWLVDRLILFESRLGPDAVHTPLLEVCAK
jgi:2'-5' RNA ligase